MRVGRTYEYERQSNDAGNLAIFALIVFFGTLFTGYKTCSTFSAYNDVGSSLRNLVLHHTGNDNQFNHQHNGHIVHVNIPQHELVFERNAHDSYLNVDVPGVVSLSRNVEYCQWMEHVHESTQKTSYGTEYVSRTYWYTKGWMSHQISSLFFDQPAAHHNPQRNPVSGGIVDRIGVSSKKGFKVSGYLMDNLEGSSYVVSFPPKKMKGFKYSPAYANEKFFYTGDNGWFLSKYQPSKAETAMKMALQYAEGTLFDFQLGDLLSVCDAGDVRVRLHGKYVTKGLSIIAMQQSDGSLVPFKTRSGRNLFIIQHGQLSAETMKNNEVDGLFWSFVRYIIAFFVCCLLLVGSCCALSEQDKKKTH